MTQFVTYQTLAGTGTAQALGATIQQDSDGTWVERVRIYVEAAPIRFTLDGTTPVAATTGEVAQVGSVIELFGSEVFDFQFINETGTASSLKMHGAHGKRKDE